eukprot:7638710-Alexandrium_andersonii.AAC.1
MMPNGTAFSHWRWQFASWAPEELVPRRPSPQRADPEPGRPAAPTRGRPRGGQGGPHGARHAGANSGA